MLRAVETVLQRHGRDLTHIRSGQTAQLRAFLQPVTARTATVRATPAGMDRGEKYLFIGPLQPKLLPGDELQSGERSYTVERAEVIFGADGPLWQWAMCRKKGEIL